VTTECPACARPTLQRPRFTVHGFAITRCTECRLGRTVLAPDQDPLAPYDEAYFQGGHRDGYADYRGSAAVLRREFRSALEHLRREGCAGGRLLELGCAYGFFLDEAARNFRVHGVEVARAAAEAARARGHDVHCGVAEESFLAARGPFDALVLLDVIEHLERPADVLALLARHAAPGAHLLVTTGDWNSLAARLMGRHWRLMTPPQHLWFFTPRTLTQVLARAGFRVLSCEHPWKRVPLGLLAYQASRKLGLQALVQKLPLPDLGVPVNLFDAMRVVARWDPQ
jgi:SAM-dependent methyltransferase